MRILKLLLGLLLCHAAPCQDSLYGRLFHQVQVSGVLGDSKTFVDAVPRVDPGIIRAAYDSLQPVDSALKSFVNTYFILPRPLPAAYESGQKDLLRHLDDLWEVLRRKSDTLSEGSSLLPLPFDYIVPGGRFREIYYWDSYFTMLGLVARRRTDLAASMVRNFDYLIHTYGHIPNGNRSYYLSRSQPPFFSMMVELLSRSEGDTVWLQYGRALEKEYAYWMDVTAPTLHVVQMPDGALLNRYYDQLDSPRPESYREDVLLAAPMEEREKKLLYRELRSAAESGWDFSSRWLADGHTLATIRTTQYVPVDLNTLLYHLEAALAKVYRLRGNAFGEKEFTQRAANRRAAILKYCWSPEHSWFTDLDLQTMRPSPALTLAGMFPLYAGIARPAQARAAAKVLRDTFLKKGGLQTSAVPTGEQWDAPNGWAPLQWISITGLKKYGQHALADTIAHRWIALNRKVYAATGKMMEKYNVVQTGLPGGGGEYPAQDGFGWTNGVLLALMQLYGIKE